jgi:hypothetical protein
MAVSFVRDVGIALGAGVFFWEYLLVLSNLLAFFNNGQIGDA